MAPADEYRNGSELSSLRWINTPIKEFMEFQDIGDFQPFVGSHELQMIVGLCVAECLVDIVKRFSLNSQAVFNHNFGFGFRQGVTFQRIAGIGQPDTVVFPK